MKILHIAPEAPSTTSGGGIVIKQTLLSLVNNQHELDYVGPNIIDSSIAKLYHRTYYLTPSSNLLLRIYDTLFMNTNLRYRAWKRLNLDLELYDAVVMDFTKLHYVLNRLSGKYLIVRIHNVEHDYSRTNLKHHPSFKNLLDFCFSGRREQLIASRADVLIALTDKDKNRFCNLYHIPKQKVSVTPVCISPRSNNFQLSQEHNSPMPLRILITGSLWFGANYEGIRWFIASVYHELSVPRTLCIAGSHPNPELKNLLKSDESISLIDTPTDMQSYFQEADLFIAPIFDGAGMKVKVAEALSYALPVIGTSHALEGYTIVHGKNSYLADSAEDFIKYIQEYGNLDHSSQLKFRQSALELFQKHYSIEKSTRDFQHILERKSTNC